MENWQFYVPTQIEYGWGRIKQIETTVNLLNGQHIFFVTGKGFSIQSGLLGKITALLPEKTIVTFSEIEENPSIETVDRGAAMCRENGCDMVIGLGGGSALDAAKAIAMLQNNPGSIREYLDQKRVCQEKGLPMIAIPTTSGTGSEVTPFAVITDKIKQSKPAIAPRQLFPDIAFVDPELTVTMPKALTAASGLDALCQAIEGFWSTRANSSTRALSFQGIVLVMRNLENACLTKEKTAVSNMSTASLLTGIQMANIGNTAIHPLSYPFTTDFGISHGFACAVFLPAFLRFNAPVVSEIFTDLLNVLNLKSVEQLADQIDALMQRLNAPRRLGEWGVKSNQLPEIVKRGIGKSTDWNPIPLTQLDIVGICEQIL